MKFLKIHSLGNSFIILDHKKRVPQENLNELAKKLCDHHTGIGADGILVALPSNKADIRMKIINADGSEAEMCGNGARCLAKYIFEKKLIEKNRFRIETISGIVEIELTIDNRKISSIRVNMGRPSFLFSDLLDYSKDNKIINYSINISGTEYHITSLLIGVTHTVIFVDTIDEKEMAKIGPQIEKHELFPQRTNVNFVKVINPTEIKLKTWERGVGISKSCGTGACASVVAANLNNKTERKVTVHFETGDLFIEWDDNDTVYMTGPAPEYM